MYLQIYKLFPCIYILFFFFRKRGKGISREYYFIRKFFFFKQRQFVGSRGGADIQVQIELQGGNEV